MALITYLTANYSKILLILFLFFILWPFLKNWMLGLGRISSYEQQQKQVLDDRIEMLMRAKKGGGKEGRQNEQNGQIEQTELKQYTKNHLDFSFYENWWREWEWGDGEKTKVLLKEWQQDWNIGGAVAITTVASGLFGKLGHTPISYFKAVPRNEEELNQLLKILISMKNIISDKDNGKNELLQSLITKTYLDSDEVIKAQHFCLFFLENRESGEFLFHFNTSLNIGANIHKIPQSLSDYLLLYPWGMSHTKFCEAIHQTFAMTKTISDSYSHLMAQQVELRDCYYVLSVTPDSDEDKVKKAFNKLALKYHPDQSKRDHETFLRLREAYDAISSTWIERKKIDSVVQQIARFWSL